MHGSMVNYGTHKILRSRLTFHPTYQVRVASTSLSATNGIEL